MGAVASGRITVRLDAVESLKVMAGLQKIANRVTLGLIMAALIVGAALLMRGGERFALWLFVAAACGGVALMIGILRHDREY